MFMADSGGPGEGRRTDVESRSWTAPPTHFEPTAHHGKPSAENGPAPGRELRETRAPQRPWYNQRWPWLIVAALVLAMIWYGVDQIVAALGGLTHATAQQTQAIRNQTDVFRSMQQTLQSIRSEVAQLVTVAQEALSRLSGPFR